MVRTAIQLYTLRDFDIPFVDLLGRVADAGFDGVEYAYRVTEAVPDDVAAAIDETGLQVPSAHVSIESLENDLETTVERYRYLRCERLVVPHLDPEGFETVEATRKTAERLDALADRLAGRDYPLLYHNHDFEFAARFDDGRTPFDVLVEETDVVDFELDVGLAAYAGADPAAALREHGDRIDTLHCTDTRLNAADPVHASYGTGDVVFPPVYEAAGDADVVWDVYENGSHDDPAGELEHAAEAFFRRR